MYMHKRGMYPGLYARRSLPLSPFMGENQKSSLPGFSPAEEKALRITDAIENTSHYSKYGTLSFRGLTGDFDGQGLSFGLLQWNVGTGSLQPLLNEFVRDYPERFNSIFGPDAAKLLKVLSQSKTQQLAWARSINDYKNPSKPRVIEPWASYFRRIGDDSAFQRIQLKKVRKRMDRAIEYARHFGLRSERGLAFMFDMVTQSGAYWLTCKKSKCKRRKKLISERLALYSKKLGRSLTDREKLAEIADIVANTSIPKYREKVRARKMMIVSGHGRVHGHDFDLERDFGLTDQPWETTAGTRPSTLPATGRSLTERIQNAMRQGHWYLALALAVLSGVRDENNLTNLIFFARHPERGGRKLVRGEPNFERLSKDWLSIRDRLVRPFLKQKISSYRSSASRASRSPSLPERPTANTKQRYDPAIHPWEAAIQLFGGRVVEPTKFPHSQAGFQQYLDASGVSYFSAKEMTTPHDRSLAKRLGHTILLPDHEWWPRGAALAKLADKIRNLVNRSVKMRNWWRPQDYNKAVKGAKDSDHITAKGIDLDYHSADDRRQAEAFLKTMRREQPWLKMSLGLGNRTTHIGLLTRRGQRTWHYKSYQR